MYFNYKPRNGKYHEPDANEPHQSEYEHQYDAAKLPQYAFRTSSGKIF